MPGGIESGYVRGADQRRLRQVQAPASGHTLQLDLAALLEAQARAFHELLRGARNEHLARAGDARDPGSDMNRDSANLALDGLRLAHVQAGSRGEAELRSQVANGKRA